MELTIGIVLLLLLWWGLGKLADHFEERSLLLRAVFYLAAGALGIMLLYAASHARR